MKTTVTDAVGVKMAGPDEPALAAAKARDMDGTAEAARSEEYLRYCDERRAQGQHPLNFDDWAQRDRAPGTGPVHDHIVGRAEIKAILASGGTVTDTDKPLHLAAGGPGTLTRGRAEVLGGSVGQVSARQVGILPTGPLRVTDEMVTGAIEAAKRLGRTLDPETARAILEASLRARA